jgi:hypothetical protein
MYIGKILESNELKFDKEKGIIILINFIKKKNDSYFKLFTFMWFNVWFNYSVICKFKNN